jgi:hypothetical protein
MAVRNNRIITYTLFPLGFYHGSRKEEYQTNDCFHFETEKNYLVQFLFLFFTRPNLVGWACEGRINTLAFASSCITNY